jgi:hypothetical protein
VSANSRQVADSELSVVEWAVLRDIGRRGEGASGPDCAPVNRLVELGLLERTSGPWSRVTAAGLLALKKYALLQRTAPGQLRQL